PPSRCSSANATASTKFNPSTFIISSYTSPARPQVKQLKSPSPRRTDAEGVRSAPWKKHRTTWLCSMSWSLTPLPSIYSRIRALRSDVDCWPVFFGDLRVELRNLSTLTTPSPALSHRHHP